jgi:ribosomal protein S18 acetylase RimI-like enzyme
VDSQRALGKAWAFERGVQDRSAGAARPFEFGTALFNARLKRVYDANLVRFERGFDELDGVTVEAHADDLQAGLAHRKVVIPDEAAGARVARELRPRGWRAYTLLVMVYEGPRELEPPRGAREVSTHVVRSAREEALGEGTRDPEARRQIAEFTDRLGEGTPARIFAARAGAVMGSFCALYQSGGVGQIDEVTTVERYRRRGLGDAVVRAALAASVRDGDSLTFLVADESDWPREWYGRIGFRAVGRRWELLRT